MGRSSFDPLSDGGHGGMRTEKLSQRQNCIWKRGIVRRMCHLEIAYVE